MIKAFQRSKSIYPKLYRLRTLPRRQAIDLAVPQVDDQLAFQNKQDLIFDTPVIGPESQ